MTRLTYQRIPTPDRNDQFNGSQVRYLNEVIRILETYFRDERDNNASNSVEERVLSVNADYTLGNNAILLVDTSAGAVSISLPEAGQRKNKVYYIKNTGTSGNSVTLTSTQNVDDSTSWTITDLDCMKIVSDGTQWWII